jgi:hypothetical protein
MKKEKETIKEKKKEKEKQIRKERKEKCKFTYTTFWVSTSVVISNPGFRLGVKNYVIRGLDVFSNTTHN